LGGLYLFIHSSDAYWVGSCVFQASCEEAEPLSLSTLQMGKNKKGKEKESGI
jgi:hypothetical protein